MYTAGGRTATIGARGQHRRPKDGVARASYADLNASPMMEVSTMKRSCAYKKLDLAAGGPHFRTLNRARRI